MIWGYVSLIICIILLLKYVSRKKRWEKLNRMLRKAHIPCAIVVGIVMILHLLVTYKVWPARQMALVGSGIVTASVILMMGLTYLFRKRLKGMWLKYHRWGAVLCIALIICHMGLYLMSYSNYMKKIAGVELSGIDLSNISDGNYRGSCDVGYISAKVEVIVKEKKIEKVTLLEHVNERGKRAEGIVDKIVEQQSTQVDSVMGASNSSLVIKKAVENALTGK